MREQSALHPAVECDSAVRRNEVLICAAGWIRLENLMPSERSQSQKATDDMIPLKEVLRMGKIHTDRK